MSEPLSVDVAICGAGPVGMALAILAVILAVLWFVVTAQLFATDVTVVGALPATAAVMAIVGEPLTPTWFTGST